MLIHPDDEVHSLAFETVVPSDRIGTDLFEGMTYMRWSIGVIDRRGYVVAPSLTHWLSPLPFPSPLFLLLSLCSRVRCRARSPPPARATSALRSASSTVRRFPSSSLSVTQIGRAHV